MADHFYGVNKGAGADPNGDVGFQAVAVGTSTTGKSIELRLHDGDALNKIEVLKALEALEDYILRPDTIITA